VNVVGHHFKRMNLDIKLGCLFLQKCLQSGCHRSSQDRPTILRTPNQVILERVYCTSVLSVFRASHNYIIHQVSTYYKKEARANSSAT
jgi:hypothetical protein